MTRTLEDAEVKMLVLDMLKSKSLRDKQTKIGASEIGNPCDYCVANRLLGKKQKDNEYWLGAKLGTSMHNELEAEAAKHLIRPQSYHFLPLKNARLEETIILGAIEGYGLVKSKPDVVLTEHNHLLDYKSTLKKKVMKYKLDGVPMQYIYQQQLYAWGLNKAGIKIERISLVFVNRDGSGDSDVWIYSFDYDETLALKAWERLELLWKWLEAGHDVETLQSDPGCFYCNQVLHRW